MSIIDNVKNLIMNEDNIDLYPSHIVLVVDYVKKLASLENEDVEALELAALLHDIGRIRYGSKDHNVTGSTDSREILIGENYSEEKIDLICDAILSHGASSSFPAKNTFSKILMSADGLSRLDSIFSLFHLYLIKFDGDEYSSLKKLSSKLDFIWTEKVVLDSAKELGLDKYNSIKLILQSNIDLLK